MGLRCLEIVQVINDGCGVAADDELSVVIIIMITSLCSPRQKRSSSRN